MDGDCSVRWWLKCRMIGFQECRHHPVVLARRGRFVRGLEQSMEGPKVDPISHLRVAEWLQST